MYYKIISVLLSVSMLMSGITGATYAGGIAGVTDYDYILETEDTVSGNTVSENTVSDNIVDETTLAEEETTVTQEEISETEEETIVAEEKTEKEVTVPDLILERVDVYSNTVNFRVQKKAIAGGTGTITAYFYYKAKNTSEWIYDSRNYGMNVSTTTDKTFKGLAEQTAYEYKIGFAMEEGIDNLINPISGEFTTPADDRVLAMDDLVVYPDNAVATLSLSGTQASGQKTYARIWWREKGSTGSYNYTTDTVDYFNKAEELTLTLNGLNPGTEYEYIYGRADVISNKLECLRTQYTGNFVTPEEDRTATYTNMKPLLTRLKVTVKVNGKNAGGNNTIWLFYKEAGKADDMWHFDSCVVSGTEPATVFLGNMESNTEYEYVIGIGKEHYTMEKEKLICTKSGKIRTMKDDRTAVVEKIDRKLGSATFTITTKGKAVEGLDNKIYVYAWKKDDPSIYTNYSTYFSGAETKTIVIGTPYSTALEEDAEYEYQIILDDNKNGLLNYPDDIVLVSGSFKSLKDDRQVSIEVTPKLNSATMIVSLAGEAAEASNYSVKLYYKPKNEDDWQLKSCTVKGNGTAVTTIDSLTQGTTYEYWAGIEKSVITGNVAETIYIGKTEGEFATKADERKLVSVQVYPEYNSARLEVSATSTDELSSCYQLYYRHKNANSWSYTYDWGSNLKDDKKILTCSDLLPGREYVYMVLLTDTTSKLVPEEYEVGNKKVEGTFQTKTADYSVQITQDMQKTTADAATLDIQATGTSKDNELRVKLYYTNTEWTRTENVELLMPAGYKKSTTLKNLEAGTTYNLTKAEIYVVENGKLALISTKPLQDTTFATLPGDAVSEITTSKDEVWLNLSENNQWGYGREKISVGVLPENAWEDVYLKKDAPDIVNSGFDSDANVLELVASDVGEAVIVLGDRNATEVEKSITAHVENYAMGYMNDGVLDTNETYLPLQCGEYKEIGYYDLKNAEPVLLEDVNITNYDEGMLEITKEGNLFKINPKETGITYIVLEKDNFKQDIKVNVTNRTFEYDILNLTTSNEAYPAIEAGDKHYVLALADVTYTAKFGVVPYLDYSPDFFVGTSSDTSVVTVSNGVITPVKAGTATLTYSPLNNAFSPESISFTVEVKEVPTVDATDYLYFMTNTRKNPKIKDIALPENLKDSWKWKNPETPIHALESESAYEELEIVYTKDDVYPATAKLKVKIGTVEKITFSEVDTIHPNGVLMVEDPENEEKDVISLQVYPKYRGVLYGTDVDLVCKKDGITIEEKTDHIYSITAQKAGDYTLTANVYDTVENKKIMSATYKVKAVKEKQVDHMTFKMQGSGFSLTDDNKVKITTNDYVGKTFTLTAKTYAFDGTVLDTPIEWKSSDPKTVSVKYDKKNTHKAVFTVKGSGNVTIYATAKDELKHQETVILTNSYRKAVLLNNKVTVNMAYDYTMNLSMFVGDEGCFSLLLPTAGGISNIRIQKTDGTPETNFTYSESISDDKYNLLIKPTKDDVPVGTYKCKLKFSSYSNNYEYPITIKVVNKQPKLSVKTKKKANLFYTDDYAELLLTVPNETYMTDIWWTDNSATEDGFLYNGSAREGGKMKLTFTGKNVKLNGKKPVDPNVAKGTLVVKLYRYKDPVVLKNVSVGYEYKKPTLKADSNNVKTYSVTPELGLNTVEFTTYDSLKGMIRFDAERSDVNASYYYEIKSNNPRVTTTAKSTTVKNIYNSTNAKEVVEYTLSSYAWREPLKLKVTLKAVKPKLALTNNTLVYNRNHGGDLSTSIDNKNGSGNFHWTGIEFKGANSKSEELLKYDILQTEKVSSYSNSLAVIVNKAAIDKLGSKVKDGTYSFKLTPYYVNPNSGEMVKADTLTLKVKIVSKDVAVKVTPKGTLDTLRTFSDNENADYRVKLQTKFSNIGDCYQIKEAKLIGAYADYFEIVSNSGSGDCPYYLVIADDAVGKVKSGHTYHLQVQYTIASSYNDKNNYVVTSNVIKLKAKQTTPKVKQDKSSLTFYENRGTPTIKRIYITDPKGYYLEGCEGYLDVNKDGQNDILVTNDGASALLVRVMDYTYLNVTESGKAHSVPVTLKYRGRDGIAKDPVVKVKVIVKR